MLKKLLAQVPGLQFVAEMLDRRQAERATRELMARYDADVKQRPKEARESAWSEYSAEYALIWDPIYVRQTNKLVAQAHKYWVRVPPKPRGPSDENWEWSGAAMDWILSDSAKERIERKISDGERQKEDRLRNRAALLISFLALFISLLSLLKKEKQPDPCPKNYYRNEQGECVFALRKTSTPQSQQSTAPVPSVQPKKPSPANPKP